MQQGRFLIDNARAPDRKTAALPPATVGGSDIHAVLEEERFAHRIRQEVIARLHLRLETMEPEPLLERMQEPAAQPKWVETIDGGKPEERVR